MGNNFGEDKAIIQEFLEVYRSSTKALLNKINKHLEKKNRAELMVTAQELRGSSANIGAVFMSGLCEYLEAEKESKGWKRSQQIVIEMEEELLRISSFTEKLATLK